MAGKTLTLRKDFSNLEEVFDKMLELDFFVNRAHRDEQLALVDQSHEHWYSNGAVEVKIFRGLFGAYELVNFRGIKHLYLEELFQVADRPKL